MVDEKKKLRPLTLVSTTPTADEVPAVTPEKLEAAQRASLLAARVKSLREVLAASREDMQLAIAAGSAEEVEAYGHELIVGLTMLVQIETEQGEVHPESLLELARVLLTRAMAKRERASSMEELQAGIELVRFYREMVRDLEAQQRGEAPAVTVGDVVTLLGTLQ